MGLLQQLRSSIENPLSPLSYPAEWLLDIFNGGRTDSGVRVSEMTSLQVSTVYACVNLISSALGFLPPHIYEQLLAKDKRPSKRLAFDHDLYDLVRYEPNEEMTSFTFRKTLQCHALLWSNAYAEIQRDGANRPVAIWPRNPARTRPYRLNNQLIYKTTDGMEQLTGTEPAPNEQTANERTILSENMLHIPGLSLDGRMGQPLIQLARQVIGLALATEKFGAKLFGNGARPGAILEHPGKLSDLARKHLQDSMQNAVGGENTHRLLITEEGMKWVQTSTNPNDAQFLETREFQRGDICSIFSVPPHMIGDSQHQNRANTEQIGLEFVTFTLGPWIESWQQEFKRKLFPKRGRTANKFFVKFDTRQLTMPDAESRRNFAATMKQWGIGSTNDLREFEDWNPVDDPSADDLWMPINMQVMGAKDGDPVPDPNAEPGDPPKSKMGGMGGKASKRFVRAYFRLFRDALGRILARSDADSAAFQRAFMPVLLSVAEAVDPENFNAAESVRLLSVYVCDMSERFNSWKTESAEAVAERELGLAVNRIFEQAGILQLEA